MCMFSQDAPLSLACFYWREHSVLRFVKLNSISRVRHEEHDETTVITVTAARADRSTVFSVGELSTSGVRVCSPRVSEPPFKRGRFKKQELHLH